MALPLATTPFPNPYSFPSLTPSPTFGLSPGDADLASIVTQLQQSPTAFGGSPLSTTRESGLVTLDWMTQGAVGPANDPNEWTPQEAYEQTDRALARIGQVNPDLARELAQDREPGSVEEPDLGFWGNLMRGAGKVLDITGLDTVLEVVSRPAHVIPEFISGLMNGENPLEAAWTGVGDSLMGRSTVTWDDILVDEFGMERNWVTGVLGFVGDVATDPLTYATFGLGGLGRAAVGKTVSTTAMASVLRGQTDDMGRLLGFAMKQAPDAFKDADDLAKYIFGMSEGGRMVAEKAGTGFANRMRTMMGQVHEDAQGGLLQLAGHKTEEEALRRLIDIGNDAFRASTTVGWTRVTDKAAAAMGLQKGEVDAGLRALVSQGSVFGWGKKAAYMQGRHAGAALGGVRLRVSLPMFGIRAQTNALPLLPARLDFSVGRRLFTGLTGQTKLMKMMGRGEATIDDMRAMWQGGIKGLKTLNPALGDQLTRGSLNPGSVFVPLSDSLGGVTKHFSVHASMLRGGGLGAKFAGEVNALSDTVVQRLSDTMRTVELPSGRVLTPKEVDDHILNWAGITRGWENVGAETRERVRQQYSDLQDYGVLMPEPGTRAKRWYDEQIQDEVMKDRLPGAEKTDPDYLAELRSRQERAIKLEQRLEKTPDWEDTVEIWRTVARQQQDESLRAGVFPDGMPDPAATRTELRPDDAVTFAAKGPERTRSVVWKLTTPNALRQNDGNLDAGVFTDVDGSGTPVRGLQLEEAGALTDESGRYAQLPAPTIPDATPQLVYGGSRLESAQEAANRVKLAQTETGAIPSPDYVARPLNLYERDLAPRAAGEGAEATQVTDLVTEVETKVREVYEAIRAGSDEVRWPLDVDLAQSDEIKRILQAEENLEEQIAPLVTAEMKARGYDGVRTRAADGKVYLTVFEDGQGVLPVAKVNPYAARTLDNIGTPMRSFTPEFRDAVGRRTKDAKSWLARIKRDTQGMSLDEAEAHIGAAAKKKGINLREHQRALEVDPVRVLRDNVDRTASQATNRYIGRAVQEAESLGFLKGAFGSQAVGVDRYKYVVSEAGVKALMHQHPEVQAAADRAAAYDAHQAAAFKQAQEDLATDLAYLENDLLDEQTRAFEAIEAHIVDSEGTELVLAKDVGKLDDGTSIRYEMFQQFLDEGKAVEVEPGLFRTGGDVAYDEAATYWDVEMGAVPPGMRKLGPEVRKPQFYIRGYRLVDEPYIKKKPVEGGETLVRRQEGGIIAATAPGSQKQGVGKRLMRRHWRDAGIDSIEKAIGVLERKSDTFSGAGAALNRSVIRDMKAELLERGRESADEALRELHMNTLAEREVVAEMSRITARRTTRPATPLVAMVPAEDAANMTGMELLEIPGFQNQAMPRFMAQEFQQAVDRFGDMSGAHRQFRQFNAWWKELATWMWPGFHVRNAEGSFFNNWLGGVDMKDYFTTRRIRQAERELFRGDKNAYRWANMKVKARDRDIIDALKLGGTHQVGGRAVEEMTYADLAMLTSDLGLTASNGRAFAEARLTVERVERSRKGGIRNAPVVGKPTRFYLKKMENAGTLTENVFRTAAFVRGVRDSGSVMNARAFTMMRHGDYHDLTDWEYGWVRDLIPFYKWMRTNTPFQIHQLLETPGKLLSVVKAQQQVFTATGRDYDEERHKMPDWMREQFILPIGGEGETFEALMLDLPMSDMTISGREFISSFLPMVRPFLESYVFEQSTFSGSPIEGKPVPLPGVFNPLGGLLSTLGIAKQGEDGTVYIDDKLQNILGIIPVFSRMKNWLYADPERAKLRGNTLASVIFGLGLRPVDEETMTDTELDFYYSQLLPQMDHLKAMGYTLPTTDDLAATVGTTETILRGLGIEPAAAA